MKIIFPKLMFPYLGFKKQQLCSNSFARSSKLHELGLWIKKKKKTIKKRFYMQNSFLYVKISG